MGDLVKVMQFSQGGASREEVAGVDYVTRLPGRYEPSRQPRWISLGLIALIHLSGFAALQFIDPDIVKRTPAVPLVVDLLPLEPPPPERKPVSLPTRQEVAPLPRPQQVVASAPIVKVPPAPVVIAATLQAEPAPSTPVKVEEARPAPARPTDTMVNLNTRLLAAEPPRYPVESRRRRETGTVVLLVVVDESGRVSAISVATSSGVDRLDKAALSAVRRWRWSPMMLDGRPTAIKGLVRIPFEIKEP